MKSLIAAAAVSPPVKGTRVAVKYGPNEWYLGTVVRSGAKVTVNFDDGFFWLSKRQ